MADDTLDLPASNEQAAVDDQQDDSNAVDISVADSLAAFETPSLNCFLSLNGVPTTQPRLYDTQTISRENEIGIRVTCRAERYEHSYTRLVIQFLFTRDKGWSKPKKGMKVSTDIIAELVVYGTHMTNVDGGVLKDQDEILAIISPYNESINATNIPAEIFHISFAATKYYLSVRRSSIDRFMKMDKNPATRLFKRNGQATPILQRSLVVMNGFQTSLAQDNSDIRIVLPFRPVLVSTHYSALLDKLMTGSANDKPSSDT